MEFCQDLVVFDWYSNHLKNKHWFDVLKINDRWKFDVIKSTPELGWFRIRFEMAENTVIIDDQKWRWTMGAITFKEKSFLLQVRSQDSHTQFWLQVVGSRLESDGFEYSLAVKTEKEGEYSYKGKVRSMDENKDAIYDQGLGLTIHRGIIQKLLQNNNLLIDVSIVDTKSLDE